MKNRVLFAPALLFFFFFEKINAQTCPTQANAGLDLHYCQGDPNSALDGSISGDFTTFSWSPAAGLSATNVLDPSVTISSGSKIYVLTTNGLTQNLVENGDFEAGNNNFTSSYAYSATNLIPEGVYTVTDNPNSVHPGFAACNDHTSGSGQMMVVNGSSAVGAVVYGQIVPVLANMTYVFSYWGCTVVGSSPAQQIFRINGTNVGTQLNYPSATCVWVKFSVTWNSGASTSANLQLINLNTATGGNDYAIDDISFQKQCTDTDTVQVFYHPDALKMVNATICSGSNFTVGNESFDQTGNYLINLQTSFGCDSIVQLNLNVVTIEAEINPNTPQIDCSTPSVALSSQNSSVIPGTQFQWTTAGGQIIGSPSAPQIVAGSIGLYKLILKYQNAFLTCTDTAFVQVTSSAQLPVAEAGSNANIGCATPTASLSGSFSGILNGQPTWTTPNGHFVNGQNTLTPVVDAAGTYILTITNPQNGCTDTDTTFVTQDLSLPMAFAGVSDTLNCLKKTLDLNGSGSVGTNFSLNWTTPNGHFVSGITTFSPKIDAPGQYFLTVVNTQNGCAAISSVSILMDTLSPTLGLSAPFILDCLVSFDTIFGSPVTNYLPIWNTLGGHFLSNQNTFSPVVDAAGIYFLTIENSINHCKTTKSIQISQNTTIPTVDAGASKLLTCANPSAILDGSIGNASSNPTINWSTVGGSFSGAQTIINPTATTPGKYFLTVVNPQNHCSATDSTVVSADPNIPIVSIATPDTLSCLKISQNLVATTNGGNLNVIWTTTNGQIISGNTTLMPQINAAGTYKIVVTNPTNGCATTQSVEVVENKQIPTAEATVLDKITCKNSAIFIDATNSSAGNNLSFNWTTANGAIISGQNTPMPIVGSAGNYLLVVTDEKNGCTAEKMVLVSSDLVPPTTLAGAGTTINCANPTAILDGSMSSVGSNFTYFWSILIGNQPNSNNLPTITVNLSGVYFLEITDENNGCTSMDSVLVFENINPPTVQISAPETLNCTKKSIQLTANGSSIGSNFDYFWSTSDGNILTNPTNTTIDIDKKGGYNLTILNTQNGCSKTEFITVLEDKIAPTAEAGGSQILTCGTTSVTIIAQITPGSSPLWTTQNGNFLGGNASLSAQIDAAGWYLLTATNPTNGCTAVDSVQIFPDAGAPILTISPPNLLTCKNTQIQLFATANAAPGNSSFQIIWTTADGQIVSGNNILSPIIDKKGIYLLTVKDLMNNCVSSQSVSINQDTISPVILIEIPAKLTCVKTAISLTAVINSLGNDFDFLWNTNNGQFQNNQNSLNPTINKIGIYKLSATDISNGCTAEKTVEIFENKTPPNVAINIPTVLTCSKITVDLVGIFNQNNSFIWSTNGGNFTQNQNTAQPTVNKTGFYFLEITNILNGCIAQDTVEVLQNITPPTVSIAKPDTLTCQKTTIQLTGIASGQGLISPSWSTTNGAIIGTTNQLSATVNLNGIYTLKIIDSANGCAASSQINVVENIALPQIFVQNIKDLTCKDSAIVLSTNNSSAGAPFQWSWNVPFSDTLKPKITLAGAYKLEIKNTKNGCLISYLFTISENKTSPLALAGGDQILTCADSLATLGSQNATPNLTFFWKTIDGKILGNFDAPTIAADQAGTYFLTATDTENGCTGIDFAVVIAQKLTAAELDIQSPACENQQGKITVKMAVGGTQPYLFSINNGQNWQNSPVFTKLAAANYVVNVADAGGCQLNLLATINAGNQLKIDLEKEAEITLGNTYLLAATINVPISQLAKIEWTPSETLTCDDCLKTVASPLSTTDYRLFVEDTSGCRDEIFFRLKVTRPPIFAPNSIKADAQSTDNQSFTLFSDAQAVSKIKKMMVFDRWGNALFNRENFQINDPAEGWFGNFRGQNVQSGVYIWWAEIEWLDGKTTFEKGDLTVF